MLRLLLPLGNSAHDDSGTMVRRPKPGPDRPPHSPNHPSVGATGGVYKGQGRILYALVTHAYEAFLVEEEHYNLRSPSRRCFKVSPDLSVQVETRIATVSVARVRPRTSKGITDLFLPPASRGLAPRVPRGHRCMTYGADAAPGRAPRPVRARNATDTGA